MGAERAQAKENGVETCSFEPPLASMKSNGMATTLTLDEPGPRLGSDALDGETDPEVRIETSHQHVRSVRHWHRPLRIACNGLKWDFV